MYVILISKLPYENLIASDFGQNRYSADNDCTVTTVCYVMYFFDEWIVLISKSASFIVIHVKNICKNHTEIKEVKMKKIIITRITYILNLIIFIFGMWKIFTNLPQLENIHETAATTTSTTISKEEPEANPKDVQEKIILENMDKKIVIEGDVSDNISPFSYNTNADKYLLDMCYATLLSTKGRRCLTDSISCSYNDKKDTTTYSITLRDNITDSSGNKITADDIIFNYYLRADSGFNESGNITKLPIIGMKEYIYGSKDTKNIEKKIQNMLKKPDKKFKYLLKNKLIKKQLEAEYNWVCSLYEQDLYDYITKKYPKKKDLFVYFFAYGTKYNTKGKNLDKIITDITSMYDDNYKKLSNITGKDYTSLARNLALQKLQSAKNFSFKINNISGISKENDATINISVKGKHSETYADKLCNMYIVTLDKWGDAGKYNGSTEFGFERGKAYKLTEQTDISKDETGFYTICNQNNNQYELLQREL